MNGTPDQGKSLEDLEGVSWPEVPQNATGLMRAVYAMRKRPIGSLSAHEMARMIGQDVGLPWLLPLALEILQDTAQEQSDGGFYDDDLLTAVLTRGSEIWRSFPDLVGEVKELLDILDDKSPYIQSSIRDFFEAIDDSGKFG
ncbi:contact-dependent growth inhibition system immunity protein [Streptomyces sp. NBC_01506]|uniref:contact-dependent growth inhibition system immunity protein n=1 Tax=Streptomyces sp. NBC_01506 TaxID=2903887 RepID=UPI0038682333